jgi:acetoin utilization deacetylase AcuC-like enzyme
MPDATPLHTWVSDRYPMPLPPGHPFPHAKYTALREALLSEGVLSPDEIHVSDPAPIEWLQLAHEENYLGRLFSGKLDDGEVRRMGIPWSPELVERARAALHGTVMAARAALGHTVAANMAGGTHHAFPGRAEGYCLFNDIAVAIAVLREEGHARRPLIVDLDVHQGNGTACFFENDPSVFTFSMHAANNFPRHKEKSSLDVGLPDGGEDDLFLDSLERHLPQVFDAHGPDLVFYQAGVDGLAEDRLGHMKLTHRGLQERDRRVFDECVARSAPVVVTLGGGYAKPIEASIAAHLNVWRAARRAREQGPQKNEAATVNASMNRR